MFLNITKSFNLRTPFNCYTPLICHSLQPVALEQYFLRLIVRQVLQGRFVKNPNINTNNLPFKVQRTSSGNLAVYPKIRLHGTIVSTVVRHVFGDIEAFKEQLRIICESPVRDRIGCLEVQGLHVTKIKKWLVHCGF